MYDKQGNIIDRREMLKIKLKSLAAEARIIRQQERAALRNENWMRKEGDPAQYPILSEELHAHRTKVVRKVARDTHIAYGLIRGKAWEQMEPNSKSQPDWDAVEKMVKKYGPRNMAVHRPELKNAA